jgi:hypothetical protein
MRKDIPEDRADAFYAAASAGRSLWAAKDLAGAEAKFMEAWQLIPEPKTDWDMSQSVSSGLVEFFKDTGQLDKALEWIDVVEGIYGTQSEAALTHVAMFRGTVLHDRGDLEGAFRAFEPQFRKWGKRPFAGLDKRYLAFVKERTGK